MEQLIIFVIVWIIANALAVVRFVLISGMNKKEIFFSLIMMNLIMLGLYIVYRVGIENINKLILIVITVLVFGFMFYFFYNNNSKC
ncbi:hypothetical protein D3C78_1614110 [compost metagenome]